MKIKLIKKENKIIELKEKIKGLPQKDKDEIGLPNEKAIDLLYKNPKIDKVLGVYEKKELLGFIGFTKVEDVEKERVNETEKGKQAIVQTYYVFDKESQLDVEKHLFKKLKKFKKILLYVGENNMKKRKELEEKGYKKFRTRSFNKRKYIDYIFVKK